MKCHLVAWFTSWSMHMGKKSVRMCTMTGCMPAAAAAMATPVRPFSAMGMSMTRSPKRSTRPLVEPKTPPASSTPSPMRKDSGSVARICSWASRRACM